MTQEESRQTRGWGLLAGVLLGLLAGGMILALWLLLRRQVGDEPEHAVRIPPRPADLNIPLPGSNEIEIPLDPLLPQPMPDAEPAAAQVDDLERVDGIGPKYAAALRAIGITSFAQLAGQDPDALAEALQAQGVRVIGDSVRQKDWIGQAARFATGEGAA
ncbi:MAG: DUF4332 domain-containing protein [Anaerolineae bacterium]|nr:DUF4332 domain-containing protein [Anaerolineae bacterium]